MFVALAAIWIVFAFLTDGVFLTARNLSNLFVQTVTTAILAIGMVLVIVAGHIDLSVGSVLGFTGAVCAMLMIRQGWGVVPAMLATLVVGLAIGAWHGFWVAYRRVPAFIVTLASMLAFRGLIIGITGGQTQGLEMAPEAVAERFKLIGQGYLPTLRAAAEGRLHDTSLYVALAIVAAMVTLRLRARAGGGATACRLPPGWSEALRIALLVAVVGAFAGVMIFYQGIPWSVVLLLALAVLFSFIANDTTFGRQLYAIGGNPDAARLSGINVPRTTFALFMVMGADERAGGHRLHLAPERRDDVGGAERRARRHRRGGDRRHLAHGRRGHRDRGAGRRAGDGFARQRHEPDEPGHHVAVRDQGAHPAARRVGGHGAAEGRALSGRSVRACRAFGA